MAMEKIVRQTLLFDFYGELLTEHQQRIYEAVAVNDTGYAEIAAQEGISRQGVHDLVKRCDRQLEEYEAKLHLIDHYLVLKEKASQLKLAAGKSLETGCPMEPGSILRLADEILAQL